MTYLHLTKPAVCRKNSAIVFETRNALTLRTMYLEQDFFFFLFKICFDDFDQNFLK